MHYYCLFYYARRMPHQDAGSCEIHRHSELLHAKLHTAHTACIQLNADSSCLCMLKLISGKLSRMQVIIKNLITELHYANLTF